MSITTTHSKNTFTGDGAQTIFTYTFAVIVTTPSLSIYLDNVLQVAGTTVAANSNQETSPGGTVTFSPAPANGVAIRIERDNPQTQLADFPLEAKLNTVSLEAVLDKAIMIIQELNREILERQIITPQSTKTASFTAVVNNFYKVNTSGGNRTVTIPSGTTVGDIIEFKHVPGGNNMILSAAANIDGNASLTSTDQHDFFRIRWDGTTWLLT